MEFARTILLLTTSLFVLTSVACRRNEVTPTGVVLSKGQRITFTNENGTVSVTYDSPLGRRFEWDGQSEVVTMIPRPEPFEGRQGLYTPGETSTFSPRAIRIVAQEGIRETRDVAQVRAALVESSNIMKWVYTSDGLVCGFATNPSRNQVNIDVRQFLVNGQKPSGLAGSRPEAIVREGY